MLLALETSAGGLTRDEAARRLARDGPNALAAAVVRSRWARAASQFDSLLIWILLAAGIASLLVGERVDATAIFAIVLLNAVIGFVQESQAESAIAALQHLTAPNATVRRAEGIAVIPAADVVVGDIVVLSAGDMVAADARVLSSASLAAIESALTGESTVVEKSAITLSGPARAIGDRANMVFLGTGIARGAGEAVVVATATRSELGHIAALVAEAAAARQTPLQQQLTSFGHLLIAAALGIVALLFGVGVWRGTPMTELLLSSISLAVAAVPEGLPAVVTVALSLGVKRMARQRALVRTLAAVETLGSTNIICTDKTGTLTVGEMTVRALYVDATHYDVSGVGYAPNGAVTRVLRPGTTSHRATAPAPSPVTTDTLDGAAATDAGVDTLTLNLLGCNSAHLVETDGVWSTVGDPTEGAMLVAGAKAGGDRARLDVEMPVVHLVPFDSDRKLSTTIRRTADGQFRALTNGAPGLLLDRCSSVFAATGNRPLTPHDHKHLQTTVSTMASQALRVLGSAYRDLGTTLPADLSAEALERDLVFVGFSGMYDPPRPEGKAAIATCQSAGITVVMITGDHPETAAAIAHELGIGSPTDVPMSGDVLDTVSDDELRQRVRHISVFSRVSAAHKLRIVRAWQANQAVVAMTGDGVNDAPAITGADIGIAMGRAGTEVTKQAADIIIVDDHFTTIVTAVEAGRGIYENIRKTMQYLLAGNVGELLLMLLCVAIGLPTPLVPIHLLWINLVTDGLPAICLATDSVDDQLMQRPPRPRGARLADAAFLRTMVLTGALTAGVALAVYVVMLRQSTPAVARGYAFSVLVCAELLRAFGARSTHVAVWRVPLSTNLPLVVVVVLSLGVQLASQHVAPLGRILHVTPIPWSHGALLLLIGAVPLLAMEVVKAVRRRRHDRAGKSPRGQTTTTPPLASRVR